jgi:hypothetical protein
MPLIQSGKTFNDGEQLTAGKLNQMFSDASLSTAGVDGTSIIVNANDVLAVRSINSSRIDSGAVITDKLPDSTDKTDGVTFAKMQHISSGKILGRTSANDGQIGESFDFKDEDDMSSDSATALASQQSIKAYVDDEISDNGITQTSGTAPYFGCRAFASYDGVNDVLHTAGNGNLTVSRSEAGKYVFTFVTAMPDDDYSIVIGGSFPGKSTISYISAFRTSAKTATSFTLQVRGGAPSGTTYDASIVDVAVFR